MNHSPAPGKIPEPDSVGRDTLVARIRHFLFGSPRDPKDRSVFHKMSVVAFLAWVGLGADGISSSCYGPEEAFRTLGEHTYLAVALAVAMTLTVTTIAIAYSRVIEHFPQGGGGYVVATALLGENAGAVSGAALLVDYVLTITVSIAAAGDALFSFVPGHFMYLKLPIEIVLILGMTILNMRGVRESILTLMPIFLLFLATHAVLIIGGIAVHANSFPALTQSVSHGFSSGLSVLGFSGLILLFIHSYSLGGGTYTGIEAVSNGLGIMREPKVRTGKRTMVYMAASLAFTASGLILCYLLWKIAPVDGKTMNAVLAESFVEVVPLGGLFVLLTLISEGALLVVAAQAGFVDGPRILANMAIDGWVPRRFASLSERLTTQNGIALMGGAALAALLYTGGDVRALVIMYSINVFITFSLTELGMSRFWFRSRKQNPKWSRKILIHLIGLTMCLTILTIIVIEKFGQGGWITLVATASVLALCFLIRRHYRNWRLRLDSLYESLTDLPKQPPFELPDFDRSLPTGIILVGGYSGLGIHTLLAALSKFPERCKNVVFVSVAVVDSDLFRVRDSLDQLEEQTTSDLTRYVTLAESLGVPAQKRVETATDPVEALEKQCLALVRELPRPTFFAGQLVFKKATWYERLLHNETAFALQARLQLAEQTLIILPTRAH